MSRRTARVAVTGHGRPGQMRQKCANRATSPHQLDDTPSRETELSTLLRELPWSANLHILTKAKLPHERESCLGTRRDAPILSALLRALPWTHHLSILGQHRRLLVGAAPDGNATDEN